MLRLGILLCGVVGGGTCAVVGWAACYAGCDQGLCRPPQPPKVYCACNKKSYANATDCLKENECRASLGCFTGICQPAQPGQCP